MNIKDRTKDFAQTYYSVVIPKRLLIASHWVDESRIKHPLSHNLKNYYCYRLNEYNLISGNDCLYRESGQRAGDILKIGYDTINRNYNPLLKRMGLLITLPISNSRKETHYTLNPLTHLKGELVNEKASKWLVKKKRETSKQEEDKFTYDNLRILEHNQRVANRLMTQSDEKVYTITEQQRKQYHLFLKEFGND